MQPTLIGDSQETISRRNGGTQKDANNSPRYFRHLFIVVKIAAGIGLLLLAIRGIQVDQVVNGLQSVDPVWLILTILCTITGLALKLWRWMLLLKNYQISANFSRLFSAYFAGQAANIILPLRGGELVRIGYYTKNKKALPGVTSTVMIEKYLDILALTIGCIVVSLQISIDNLLDVRRFLLLTTIAVTVFLLFVILLFPRFWVKLKGKVGFPQGLVTVFDDWIQSSQRLKNPREIFPSVLLTILIWAAMWLTNLLLFRGLGLPVSGVAGGTVLVLVYIGMLPALMPGNLGPFYFFASIALLPFGILHSQAVVFAVILHGIVTLPPLLCGAAGLVIHSK